MAAEVSTTTQLINIGVQCINLALFYVVFKKIFGDQIIAGVEAKKAMIHKIKHAEQEYSLMMEKARNESDSLISHAMNHKKTIIDEAHMIAQKKTQEMIDTATNKADDIIATAQIGAKKLEQDLKDNFETGVKSTVEVVVSKLLGQKPELEKMYMEQLVKEATK